MEPASLKSPEELELGEAVDLRFVDTRLAFEGEGVERPLPRQIGLMQTIGETALASRRSVLAKQPIGIGVGESIPISTPGSISASAKVRGSVREAQTSLKWPTIAFWV
jgi:hypothetical protein